MNKALLECLGIAVLSTIAALLIFDIIPFLIWGSVWKL